MLCVPRILRAFVPYVPCFLRALVPYVPRALSSLAPHVTCALCVLKAPVPCVSRALSPMCLHPFLTLFLYVTLVPRTFSILYANFTFCVLEFPCLTLLYLRSFPTCDLKKLLKLEQFELTNSIN